MKITLYYFSYTLFMKDVKDLTILNFSLIINSPTEELLLNTRSIFLKFLVICVVANTTVN